MPMKHCTSKIRILLFLFFILTACQKTNSLQNSGVIQTINGPVEVDKLKFTFTHEHLMSNFGKDLDEAPEYDEAALLSQVIPYLRKVKSLGVNSIFDCTTAYFGRRVDLLKTMADSTGIQIVTNRGFYGAADERYVTAFDFGATAEEISKAGLAEFEGGIDGPEVRPGFVKLAFDVGM